MLVKNASIETLIELNDQIKADFSRAFSGLTSQQLNWKASPDSWSIAQCAEHLIKINDLYLDRLEDVLASNTAPTTTS